MNEEKKVGIIIIVAILIIESIHLYCDYLLLKTIKTQATIINNIDTTCVGYRWATGDTSMIAK